MELKDLAKKIGVKNIVVTNINSYKYKDNITIVINDDLVISLVGKTFSFIPLTINGVNKGLSNACVRNMFDTIKKELKEESI